MIRMWLGNPNKNYWVSKTEDLNWKQSSSGQVEIDLGVYQSRWQSKSTM